MQGEFWTRDPAHGIVLKMESEHMTTRDFQAAALEALHEAGATRDDSMKDLMHMTECQFYAAVRTLMHKLDAKSGKLDVKRYGYKAVAGAMREIREMRNCER